MLKRFALIALIAITSSANAGAPPIAYAKGSTSQLYLANDNSSPATLLYTSPRRKKIFDLAMSPGSAANEIAIVEGDCCLRPTNEWTLKLISYNDSGVKTGERAKDFTGCRIDSLDYRPSSRTLAYTDCNRKIWTLDTSAQTLTPVEVAIGTGKTASKVSWKSWSTLLVRGTRPTDFGLFTFDLASPTAWTLISDRNAVLTIDVAADGSQALTSESEATNRIKLVWPLAADANVRDITAGVSPRFSPDGLSFAYIAPDARGQSTIKVRPVADDPTVTPVTIAKRGEYSALAWANTGQTTSTQQTDFGIRPVQ